MRTLRILRLTTLLAASGVVACGDNTGPGDPLPASLVATWIAEPPCSPACSFTVTSVSNASASVDLVAASNVTVELRLTAEGGATLVLFGQTTPGSAHVDGSTLFLSSGGSTDTIDYTVTATTLDLRFRNALPDLFYDFDGDQILEPTVVRLIMTKE